VYSFGIILHEVFYRMGPFAGNEHITMKGLVQHMLVDVVAFCFNEFNNCDSAHNSFTKNMLIYCESYG